MMINGFMNNFLVKPLIKKIDYFVKEMVNYIFAGRPTPFSPFFDALAGQQSIRGTYLAQLEIIVVILEEPVLLYHL